MKTKQKAEEKLRRYRNIALIINTIVFASCGSAILYFYYRAGYSFSVPFQVKSFLVLAFASGVIAYVLSVYERAAIRLMMPFVITKFEDRFGQEFAYARDYEISKWMLRSSGLVDVSDEVDCSDMIKVEYPDGDKMSLANVDTYRIKENREGKKRRILVDSGIFVRRVTNLNTDTYFVIRDREFFADKSMRLKGEDMLLVKKVHSAFDKHYRLYTKDSIRAFRFLSPHVIEKFLEMANIKGHVAELSVFDNEVNLFINGAKIDIVVQSILRTPKFDQMVQRSFENINAVLEMIDFVYNEQRMARLSKAKQK